MTEERGLLSIASGMIATKKNTFDKFPVHSYMADCVYSLYPDWVIEFFLQNKRNHGIHETPSTDYIVTYQNI